MYLSVISLLLSYFNKSPLRLRDEGGFSVVPPCLMVIVELRGLEPLTFSMPLRRAPNCATAPRFPSALQRGNDRYSATATPLRLQFTVAAPRRVRPFRAPLRRLAGLPPSPGSLWGWPIAPAHSLFRLVFQSARLTQLCSYYTTNLYSRPI